MAETMNKSSAAPAQAATPTRRTAGYKRKGQKYKSLLVWQVLLKRTDEEHPLSVDDIQDHLRMYGVETERRSIYRDIKDLQTLLETDYDADIEERERLGYEIGYTRKQPSGYMITQRPYSFDDVMLLAECINSAKFISKTQAEGLREMLGSFCSEAQEARLLDEVYNIDRVKTPNTEVIYTLSTLNEAIKNRHKISFNYMKYTVENRKQQTARRRGTLYTVSPYTLLINDGNYYALSYDARRDRLIPYRVDRMRDVKELSEEREGYELYRQTDMRTYTRRVFGMFGGEKERVLIRFTNDMIDTVVDRFGPGSEDNTVYYRPDDKSHFVLSADIEISNQFFSWICGFHKKATIIGPPRVIDDFKSFLADISERYNEKQPEG